MENVDPDDLACREAKEVLDWYHLEWFRHDNNGDLRSPHQPSYSVEDSFVESMAGTVLCSFTGTFDVIPILLVAPDQWPEDKISEIVQREINEDEILELPDLLINTAHQKLDEEDASDDPSSKVNINIKINF